MSEAIDITGIDRGELLAALHNGTRPLGMGFLHDLGRSMSARGVRGNPSHRGRTVRLLPWSATQARVQGTRASWRAPVRPRRSRRGRYAIRLCERVITNAAATLPKWAP